jgi:hypothetical protein
VVVHGQELVQELKEGSVCMGYEEMEEERKGRERMKEKTETLHITVVGISLCCMPTACGQMVCSLLSVIFIWVFFH